CDAMTITYDAGIDHAGTQLGARRHVQGHGSRGADRIDADSPEPGAGADTRAPGSGIPGAPKDRRALGRSTGPGWSRPRRADAQAGARREGLDRNRAGALPVSRAADDRRPSEYRNPPLRDL